ncbi:TAXI family TRAP transporter solute-binding subunit [Bacillus licheniformis]|nr:TAXI family TRAP transporter solute-binding subunit [Bacillus licheniformis]
MKVSVLCGGYDQKGTYGIGSDVNTVAVKAMLVASDKMDEDTVYK